MSATAGATRGRRKSLGLLLQIAVSAALLAALARQVDLRQAWSAMARLKSATLAGALALTLVGYWGRSTRWSTLLRGAGIRVSGWDAYRLTLLGNFYGLLTPGRVGELGRILHLNLPPSRTLPSAIWDRAADLLLLEAMSLPAFILISAWHGVLLWIYMAVVVVTAGGLVALDSVRVSEWLGRRVPRLGGPLARWHAGATGMLWSRAFGQALLSGLFYYVFAYAGAWLLLRDVAGTGSPRLALSFPVVALLGNLPIAFGGLGLREQVAAILFGQFGASRSAGPAFSLSWFVLATLIPGLLGAALGAMKPGQVAVDGSAPLEIAPSPEQGRGVAR